MFPRKDAFRAVPPRFIFGRADELRAGMSSVCLMGASCSTVEVVLWSGLRFLVDRGARQTSRMGNLYKK